jgi:polyhydroxybutyrate depolymerase
MNCSTRVWIACLSLTFALSGCDRLRDELDGDDDLIAARPYRAVVSSKYRQETPVPLVISLHGFSSNSAEQDNYFRLSPLAEARNFILALPEGTLNVGERRFWDATDACCNFLGPSVDDVSYLEALIEDVQGKYNIDSKRVFVIGHSNGGFMAHRLACDHSELIAAFVSLAGANWKDVNRCQPSEAVSVLQVHGTSDQTIRYEGGTVVAGVPNYPSAQEATATWISKNRCSSGLTDTGERLDLDTVVTGSETKVERASGCPDAGVGVELWTIDGGGHVPSFAPDWGERIYDFLQAHPKP